MVSVIIPNPDNPQTPAGDLQNWTITRSEISSYLIFFDLIGYFSGHTPQAAFRIGNGTPFKLGLPLDAAFNPLDTEGNRRNCLIRPFVTRNARETVAQAMHEQLIQGFKTAPDEYWVLDPRYFKNVDPRLRALDIAPVVELSFFDGLWCPSEDVVIDEVLRFKEDRADQRNAFLKSLLMAAENTIVSEKGMVLGVKHNDMHVALKELNQVASERWSSGLSRVFSWGIRPKIEIIPTMMAATAGYISAGLAGAALATVTNSVSVSISLQPLLEKQSKDTHPVSFYWEALQRFPNLEDPKRSRYTKSS